MTIFDLVEQFPPNLCRRIAIVKRGVGTRPISHSELAEATGLSRSYISVLSCKRSWTGVPIEIVAKFQRACGVNALSPGTVMTALMARKNAHFRRATKAQRIFLSKLF